MGTEIEKVGYLPARRCQRVAFSIFLCFFLRMRLRRFLISDPMSDKHATGDATPSHIAAPIRTSPGLASP